MANFIETLFGIAIVAAVVALVFLLRRRRTTARKFGLAALVLAGVAGIIELYLQMRT